MQPDIQICLLMENPNLSDRVSRLCAAQGWSVWLKSLTRFHDTAARADVLIFDDLSLLKEIGMHLAEQPQRQAIYISDSDTDIGLPERCAFLAQDHIEQDLVQAITTALNVARFESQFFTRQAAEPITKLPHHGELLNYVERFQDQPMGLVVVQIDHAQHLYANLDPVSKTDLLSALSEYLHTGLPHAALMGIYDAATFAIWCPDITVEALADTAQGLCHTSRAPLSYRGGELHFSISAGYAYSAAMSQAQPLWQLAWSAKERARTKGGNRVEAAKQDADLSARIPSALSRDEFSLVVQPQWDIQGQALKGVETLLRWQGMEVGNIAPDHFIPIAEQNGQMARVGDWVLERACAESATWLEHLVSPILLGVNISPQQFGKAAIAAQIERLSKEQWLDPSILELELPHDNLLHIIDRHRSTLFELRDRGVRVAIDNLGTGVVDTHKLLRCPADTLKIDRSLIANMEQDDRARTLVAQICQVGERFSLRTVAVGVETESQRQLLENLGCSDAQGYLFAEPIPLRGMQKYLSQITSEQGADDNPSDQVSSVTPSSN